MSSPSPKQALRRDMKRRLRALTDADRSTAGAAAAKALGDLDGPVALFASMRAEFSTLAIDDALRAHRTQRAFPRYDAGALTFYACPHETAAAALPVDERGIGTPDSGWPVLDAPALHVVLCPGLAIDSAGHRLGRGGGYYDAFISHAREVAPQLQFWGLFFDFQCVADVPTEQHDQRLDGFFTPTRGLVKLGQHAMHAGPPD